MIRVRLAGRGLLVLAFAVGAVVRVGPVLAHSWPLHEGGFFYAMVGEIVQAGLRLPATTAYDGAGIPFAYPPLALWLTALLEAIGTLSRADLFRLLPLAFSLAELPAFYLLARDLLAPGVLTGDGSDGRRSAGVIDPAAVALLAFAVEPYAYEVHITGGGLTRSLGMLFAILAVWQGLRMLCRGGWRPTVATAVLAGLGAMSHPESGVFVVVALGTAVVLLTPRRESILRLAAAALGAVVVAAPWWLGVILVHGPSPLVTALTGTNKDLAVSLVTFLFIYLAEGPLPILGLLALFGEVHAVVTRRPFLVVWLAVLCLIDLRYSPVAGAVPMSLLVAIGLVQVLVPAVGSFAARLGRREGHLRWSAASVIAAGVVLAVIAVGLVQNATHWYGAGVALDAADRQAMAWVVTHQPIGRSFVVLGGPQWGSDDVAEWFPALAERPSLTTSQGLEWVAGAHAQEGVGESALRACQPEVGAGCLAGWLEVYAVPRGDWAVYLAANGSSFAGSTPANAAAEAWIRADPDLRVIYDGPGALIAVPTGSAVETSASAAR